MLGWVHGAWCDPADLDRLFRLRADRCLDPGGFVRYRHWRLYGERGLAGAQAAVWLFDQTLTLEYATDTLAQYHVVATADGRSLRAVTEPQLFATRYPSPQPFLPPLDTLAWDPAQPLGPSPRRRPSAVPLLQQLALFDDAALRAG